MGQDTDDLAGFEILDDFERFSQVDDVFSRSFWDEAIRTDKTDRFYATYRRPLTRWRKANGFTQRDYAVRNAAWHVSDVFTEMHEHRGRRDGFLDPLSTLRDGPDERLASASPEEAARQVKRVAQVFGADLIGITDNDDRWLYTERFGAAAVAGRAQPTHDPDLQQPDSTSEPPDRDPDPQQPDSTSEPPDRGPGKPNELGPGLTSVIVIGQAMDPELIRTAPSALAGAATGLGYSRDATVLLAVAQYLRNLGYRAVPSMNDSALAIPLAIKAGLGEYGRHGMVITPEFGTQVRFGKIFTDLPLAHDRPRRFGVQEFCRRCDRCAGACPASAIPRAGPVAVAINRSGLKGVRKWSVDGEACFGYWSKINSDCAICIRVCPYSRDYTRRRHRWWRRLAGSRLRRLALLIDDRMGGGRRLKPNDWWSASS